MVSIPTTCFVLWEDGMEKWGCNGLGEALDDRRLVFARMSCSTTKLIKIQISYEPDSPSLSSMSSALVEKWECND